MLTTEREVFQRLRDYKPLAAYPKGRLGHGLQNVAALIASGHSTRVYHVALGGFDTHAGQLNRHQRLLRELSAAMAAFQADPAAQRLDDRVLTMTYSEFGRRLSENASGGTDHGTAAPVFVMGSRLRGPLFGNAPDLNVPSNQGIKHSTDFRAVYSGVVEHWFHSDPEKVLGRRFEAVPFIRPTDQAAKAL